MVRFSRLLFSAKYIFLGILVLIPQMTQAAEREINGFKNYHFGMSEQDIASITKIASREESPVDAKTAVIKISDQVVVDWLQYNITLSLHNGQLVYISVNNNTAGLPIHNCGEIYNGLYALVKTKYGNADFEPEPWDVQGEHLVSTSFTAFNGNAIEVSMEYQFQKQNCIMWAAYRQGNGGNPF
jgi:hypothetical protein